MTKSGSCSILFILFTFLPEILLAEIAQTHLVSKEDFYIVKLTADGTAARNFEGQVRREKLDVKSGPLELIVRLDKVGYTITPIDINPWVTEIETIQQKILVAKNLLQFFEVKSLYCCKFS